jgi:hypothetical protein
MSIPKKDENVFDVFWKNPVSAIFLRCPFQSFEFVDTLIFLICHDSGDSFADPVNHNLTDCYIAEAVAKFESDQRRLGRCTQCT